MLGLSEKFDVLNKRRSQQAPWHAHKTSPSGETILPTNNQGIVEIFDTRGVKVYTNKLTEGNNNINIDLRNLNNGIYIYKVIVNGEVKKSDKIIVIH
jgi:hypothetical protein